MFTAASTTTAATRQADITDTKTICKQIVLLSSQHLLTTAAFAIRNVSARLYVAAHLVAETSRLLRLRLALLHLFQPRTASVGHLHDGNT